MPLPRPQPPCYLTTSSSNNVLGIFLPSPSKHTSENLWANNLLYFSACGLTLQILSSKFPAMEISSPSVHPHTQQLSIMVEKFMPSCQSQASSFQWPATTWWTFPRPCQFSFICYLSVSVHFSGFLLVPNSLTSMWWSCLFLHKEIRDYLYSALKI